MDAVLQPFFLAGSQPAHMKVHQPVDGHSLRFFCGGELGAGFADMRGMAFAGEFFVRFVLPADFAVMAVGAVGFLPTHEGFPTLH